MITKKITIQRDSALEARPVAMLVQVANKFDCIIYLECENKKVNAKSIMGMMALGLVSGEDVLISADGSDEETAVEEIEKYLCCAEA